MNDSISAKFGDLQQLREAVATARASLEAGRSDWMSFTTGQMSTGWGDGAGDQNQMRNSGWSNMGQSNEDFLNDLDRAIDQTEMELRGAVQRARTAMGG
jgi:hypothetical protein